MFLIIEDPRGIWFSSCKVCWKPVCKKKQPSRMNECKPGYTEIEKGLLLLIEACLFAFFNKLLMNVYYCKRELLTKTIERSSHCIIFLQAANLFLCTGCKSLSDI